jgi:putative pyruvate formate lyase activating enzyme
MKFSRNSYKDLYKNCTLCPWDCRIDRTAGKLGVCKSSDKVKVSSAAPHFGEEPMISGKNGSGTIFFSNCNMRCKFCQNYQISQEGSGDEISDEQLADLMLMLQKKGLPAGRQGCHNINLVSPTHYLPNILEALMIAEKKGLNIPIVYNSNGYEKSETIKLLEGIVDIYLPDIKYSSNDVAVRLSNAPKYVDFNKTALKEMFRQVGNLKMDERGIAVKGLLIRHLVLPNDLAGSQKSLKFLANEISKDVHLGIMAQYKPCFKANDDPEISRTITENEYKRALRWAKEAGLHNILVQELESADNYLPDFKSPDPFK